MFHMNSIIGYRHLINITPAAIIFAISLINILILHLHILIILPLIRIQVWLGV